MMQKITLLLSIIGLLGFALMVTPTPAPAQEREFSLQDHAMDHGYRDGYAFGAEARARRERLNFDNNDYRVAERGYRPYLGSIEDYRVAYRQGYRQGAEDGYNGSRTRLEERFVIPDRDADRVTERTVTVYRDRKFAYDEVASDIGYRDGVTAGAKDYREHHSYRPHEHDSFKDADRGYNPAFGRKDEYKSAYRVAFEQGYRAGFGLPR
jgi:hypothetical protein